MAGKLPESIGPYRVVSELGRGTMGTVYLAVQESLGRDLAIKLLATEFTRDEEFVERFKREGKIAARLRHPNIVQVYDFSDRDGVYYIAMEYLGKRNLKQYLEENGQKLPVAEAVRLADQILAALEHAHGLGIVHRDVKPANIMITERVEATLTDFSIAHMKFANRLTQTGAAVGTPEYMAPEQFDAKNVDGRADLYAVGLILYEMLTGVHPFHAETISEVMKHQFFTEPQALHEVDSNIPKTLGLAIKRALCKSAADRYQTAGEMRQALQVVSTGDSAPTGSSLDQFLADVASGKISLDDANHAREKVKAAIDQGFRKNLTFMMVDLAGSSKIKVPHQTLHADRAFRDYRATINAVLKEFGCMSYEWAGDGAICIFAAPLPALQAAVKMQGLVDAVGDRHPDLPDKLRARIGINTGEVYLDPRRGLGEFASRTVDQAGHLEKDCPVGEVRVSQTTMEQTRHVFEFVEIGVNRDDIMVYEVRTPAPVLRPPDSTAGKAKVSLSDGQLAAPATEKFCPNCGQPSLPGARFCPHCAFEMGSLTRIKEPLPEKREAAPPPLVAAPAPPPPPPPPPMEMPLVPVPAAAVSASGSKPIQNRPARPESTLAPPPPAPIVPSMAPLPPMPRLEEVPWMRKVLVNQGPSVLATAAFCCFLMAYPGANSHSRNALKAILMLSGMFGLFSLTLASLLLSGYLFSSGEGARRTFGQLLITSGIAIALTVLLMARA